MMQLALLIRQRDPKAVQATDTLLKIFLEQLTHDDSYIYLAAIQGLVSLADVRADMVIPQLAYEFAMCQKEAGNFAVRTKDVNEKGYYKPSKTGWLWFLFQITLYIYVCEMKTSISHLLVSMDQFLTHS